MIKKKEEFGKKFIYCTLALWMSTEVIFNTTIEYVFIWKKDELNDVLAYFVLLLLVLQIVFFQNYQLKEIIVIGIISIFFLYATINSNYNALLSTWIFIVASKYIDFEKFIKLSYYIQLFMFALVLYLFFNGYIQDYTMFRGSVLRHSLGFSHPNQLGIRVFLLMVCRCYYRRTKINVIDISLVFLAAFFVNKVSNSKTSYYALIILAIITIVYIIATKLGSSMNAFANVSILIAVFSNVGSVLLSNINVKHFHWLNAFDLIMSRRFSQCYRTMKFYGINLFGQDIQLIVKRPIIDAFYRFWLDNAYMAILLRYGIIVFLIFSLLYFMTMIQLKQTKQFYLLGIMALYSIYGIMENNYFAMSQNMFLLALSFPIFMDNISNRKGFISKFKLVWH